MKFQIGATNTRWTVMLRKTTWRTSLCQCHWVSFLLFFKRGGIVIYFVTQGFKGPTLHLCAKSKIFKSSSIHSFPCHDFVFALSEDHDKFLHLWLLNYLNGFLLIFRLFCEIVVLHNFRLVWHTGYLKQLWSENNEQSVNFFVSICSACNSILTVNDKLAFLMLPCHHF
jgi:hypothetical protein